MKTHKNVFGSTKSYADAWVAFEKRRKKKVKRVLKHKISTDTPTPVSVESDGSKSEVESNGG